MRLGGGHEQDAQIRIVARLTSEHGGAARRLADEPGAQIDPGHADHRALNLVAVRQQQLAERASRRFAAAWPAHPGDDPLLPFQVERVQTRDHGRRRPVAQRPLEDVDRARALARAALADRARFLRPADDLIEPVAPVSYVRRQRRQRGERERHLFGAAPGGEQRDDQLGGRPQQALVGLRDPRRRAPELGGVVERQRLAKRLEDGVVDVVVLEIADLGPQLRGIQGQHRVEQILEQLGAEPGSLGRVQG